EQLAQRLAPLPTLRATRAQLDALAAAEGRRGALQDSARAMLDVIGRLDERRARLATAPEFERDTQQLLEARRAELETAQADHAREHTAWVRDQQEAQTKREALRAQFADVQHQRDEIEKLGPESPCPTCTRPLGQSFRTVLDALDEQLDTLLGTGRYFKNRVEQLETEPAPVTQLGERRRALATEVQQLERRLAKCQAGVQELGGIERDLEQHRRRLDDVRADIAGLPTGYDAARHASVRDEVAALAPLEQQRARAETLVAREAQTQAVRDRVTAALTQVRDRVAALHERRRGVAIDEERYTELRSAHERAEADARASELAAVQAHGEARSAREALESAEQARRELAKVQARLDTLQAEKRLHDELDRAYSDLRTDLNFQLRPELSELASQLLDDLTDARYAQLELDDQYNVIVLEDGVPKPVISGGEEDLANLVLRLAISQMIADRAGQSFSLLILDEVFGSLDETRRANVVELLRRLHDRFEQVIVITHIEDVREGLDQVIRVRYDEARGSSVVEQEDVGEGSAFPLDDAPLLQEAS
ncbi:MAG: SbcC/MukB-like Walker B domain-containing protein, partial [Gemmatirosa sp.]